MTGGEPSAVEARERIAQDIVQVLENSYGASAERVQVQLGDDWLVVVVDVELTQAEQTLAAAGHYSQVKAMREAFQEAIAPTFKAIAERNTGRRVVSFLSAMSVDEPYYSIEFYRLGESS